MKRFTVTALILIRTVMMVTVIVSVVVLVRCGSRPLFLMVMGDQVVTLHQQKSDQQRKRYTEPLNHAA